jgi:hypothetical protein
LDIRDAAGYTTSKAKIYKTSEWGTLMMADERLLFWQKKLAENQQVLEVINSGQFTSSDGGVIDETTLAEVRQWAMRRVRECEARIAERTTAGGDA